MVSSEVPQNMKHIFAQNKTPLCKGMLIFQCPIIPFATLETTTVYLMLIIVHKIKIDFKSH